MSMLKSGCPPGFKFTAPEKGCVYPLRQMMRLGLVDLGKHRSHPDGSRLNRRLHSPRQTPVLVWRVLGTCYLMHMFKLSFHPLPCCLRLLCRFPPHPPRLVPVSAPLKACLVVGVDHCGPAMTNMMMLGDALPFSSFTLYGAQAASQTQTSILSLCLSHVFLASLCGTLH